MFEKSTLLICGVYLLRRDAGNNGETNGGYGDGDGDNGEISGGNTGHVG